MSYTVEGDTDECDTAEGVTHRELPQEGHRQGKGEAVSVSPMSPGEWSTGPSREAEDWVPFPVPFPAPSGSKGLSVTMTLSSQELG